MNRKNIFFFFLIVLLAFITIAYAQETISPEEAINFIGQEKTVCGPVAASHYAARSKGKPTFLNFKNPYPHQVFTVLIWGSDRSKFAKPPETLSGKEICVTGLIQKYRDRAEIIVRHPSQILEK